MSAKKKKYRAIEQLRQKYGGVWVSDHVNTWTCTDGQQAGRSVEARASLHDDSRVLYWVDTPATVALHPATPGGGL